MAPWAIDDNTLVSSLADDNNVVEFELIVRDSVTRVNIETMYADSYYTFFIHDPNATILDVKHLVLPLIDGPLIHFDGTRPLLDELELYFNDGVVGDDTLLSSLAHDNVVELDLMIL